MAGRTLLQQAAPISFGLKAAGWLMQLTRSLEALARLRESLAVQLGGSVGTLAALGERGLDVVEGLARALDLTAPDLPWHAQRDRIVDVVDALGRVAAAAAKIGNDLALLAQTEVGEVTEGSSLGKGVSSAMPQKRNPVDSTLAVAAARLARSQVQTVQSGLTQEHERGLGEWQAEQVAVPAAFRHTAGALAHARAALEGLEVDTERMRANLKLLGGVINAEAVMTVLAPALGRDRAECLVSEACSRAVGEGTELGKILATDARVRDAVDTEVLDRALDPTTQLGAAAVLVERALARFRDQSTSSKSPTR